MASTGTFNFIVVGAGTAGCVIAARLSERGTVLLLEAGGDDKAPPQIRDAIARPENVFPAILQFPRRDVSGRVNALYTAEVYMTEPQRYLGGRSIRIDQGAVRGGGSSINGMIYVRGRQSDYDGWESLGNPGWGFKDVLPFFRGSENCALGASAFHGVHGPLDVGVIDKPSLAALAFIDAAKQVFAESDPGWDFNGARQEKAAGLYQVTVSRDPLTGEVRRASSATAFLDKAATPNLTVALGARATRIEIVNNRAVGVEVVRRGDRRVETYHADREIIVSAGPFESPKLLMLSGIGPAAHLKPLGLKPLVDLPGVGQNLHDHLELLIYHPPTQDPGDAEFTAEAGLFMNSRHPAGDLPIDLQFHVLGDFPGKAAASPIPSTGRRPFLICPVLCRPQSRGELRLRSAGIDDPPIIDPHYLESDADMPVLVRGIEWAEHFARLGQLGKLLDRETSPYVVPRPLDAPSETVDLPDTAAGRAEIVRRAVQTVWHPVGTCKMGHDRDSLAVVNPRLQVRGVDGLRVADASIMPSITTGNTNAVCFMIGEKCAALIP